MCEICSKGKDILQKSKVPIKPLKNTLKLNRTCEQCGEKFNGYNTEKLCIKCYKESIGYGLKIPDDIKEIYFPDK